MSNTISYKTAIANSMQEIMAEKDNAIVMGQGVADLTRIFGSTAGLLEKYGKERVIDMPICEEAMSGMAVGMSLNGLYPIQTHIRVDFLILALNQIFNLIAKYKYMYGGSKEVPMLIRAVVGRSWGQGPQHSQSIQSILSHVPGLTVLMPASAASVAAAYKHAALNFKGPVISLEHRFLYDTIFNQDESCALEDGFSARVVETGSDVTIVATSYMVQEAQRAARWVKENADINCEIIDLHNISHIDHKLIQKSLQKTRHLIIADTSWKPFGVCAEISRMILETDPQLLKAPVSSLGLQFTPTPTSHALEKYFYPDMGNIVEAIYSQVSHKKQNAIPTDRYIKEQHVEFRGPF